MKQLPIYLHACSLGRLMNQLRQRAFFAVVMAASLLLSSSVFGYTSGQFLSGSNQDNNFSAVTSGPTGVFYGAWKANTPAPASIKIATYNAGTWTQLTSITGTVVAAQLSGLNQIDDWGGETMAVDASGDFHIIFAVSSSSGGLNSLRGLVYGKYTASNSTWAFRRLYIFQDPSGFKGVGNGEYNLKLDTSGNPHVVVKWSDANNGTDYIKYAFFNGTSWNATGNTNANDGVLVDSSSGNRELFNPSITFDSAGVLHCCYARDQTDQIRSDCWYSKLVSGTWTTPANIAAVGNFYDGSIVTDSSNVVSIGDVFQVSDGAPQVNYRLITNASGSFQTSTIGTYTPPDSSGGTYYFLPAPMKINAAGKRIMGLALNGLDVNGNPSSVQYRLIYETAPGVWQQESAFSDDNAHYLTFGSMDLRASDNTIMALFARENISPDSRSLHYTTGVPSSFTGGGASAPTVATATQSSVTHNSAFLGGNVSSDGGATVTERGIVWETSTGPTTANNKVQISSGTGTFGQTVTGLPANTTVFVRAYAINSVNTSYGSEISFTTLSNNADLSALTTAASGMTPAFGAATIAYNATVPNGTTATTVTATQAQANATLQVQVNSGGFSSLTSGVASSNLNLNVGANPIDVRVTAQDGVTQKTYTITVTRAAGVPSAPTIGTATAGNASASVAFTAPASTGGSAILDYTATSSPAGITATGSSSPINITGLTNGTPYTFTVTARNAVGSGAASAASNSVTPAGAPTVTNVAPSSGTTAGGTSVTITGTNFTVPATVTIGGNAATSVVVSNATTITCVTPAGTAGTASVLVNTPGGTNAANTLFTYLAAPSAPTIGTATAGNASASVAFTAPASNGGSAITGYTVTSSPGGITATGATSPINVTGLTNGTAYTFTVTATNIVGTGAASAASNSVIPASGAPTVTNVAPSSGPTTGGTSVTITGTGFTGATAVTIGGAAATSVVVGSATQITATTPAGSAGTASVLVTTPGGTNAANTLFTYTGAPSTTITSLNRANTTPSNASTVNWTLTFAAANTGVSASNFSLSGAAAAGASVGTPTTTNGGLTWNVPITTGSTDGTLTLNFANATGTTPGVSTALPFAGQDYTMDKTAPTIGIGSPSLSTIVAGAGSVTYTVTYADTNFSASTLSTGNVTLNTTGTANGTVAVSGSGLTRTVTLSSITGVGSLGISIAAGTASDAAGNTAPAAGPSGTFAVTATTDTEIASTGTLLDASNNLPAGGSLSRVFPGVINEDGNISFKALGAVGTGGFTAGNSSLMLTNYPSGNLSVIGQQGMLLPDSGALKGTFDNLVLTKTGRTISFDQFSGAAISADHGYLIAEGAATSELLSREGDTATEGGTFIGHAGRHAADDEERVYFICALSGVATTKNGGIWYDDAGALEVMAKKGDDVGTLTGDLAWLGNFSAPLSAAGEGAAFITALQNNPDNAAQKTATAKNAAIFGGAAGALELVARKGDVIPAVGTLNSFSGVSRASNGDHAFISLLAASTTAPVVSTSNDQVLMAEIGGVKHLVARENTMAILASLMPTRFGNFYMTSRSEVIYQAWLTGAGVTATNDAVLCRWTATGGNEVLAREGDTAPGTTLKYGTFQVISVSPGGAIALQSTLSSGIAVMRAEAGAGFGLVVRTQTNVLVNGTNLKVASLAINDSGAGTGGGGGGLGDAINDDGAIFTVLTTTDGQYVTRIFTP